jgi:hypothetical protein
MRNFQKSEGKDSMEINFSVEICKEVFEFKKQLLEVFVGVNQLFPFLKKIFCLFEVDSVFNVFSETENEVFLRNIQKCQNLVDIQKTNCYYICK